MTVISEYGVELLQTSLPKRNKELFHAIATAMREEPEHYNQRVWGVEASDFTWHTCGTAHCVAGFAVTLSGFRAVGRDWSNLIDNSSWFARFTHGVPIEPTARHLLGLTDAEANILFATKWLPFNTTYVQSHSLTYYHSKALTLRVADMMDKLAEGASVDSVTYQDAVFH